MNDQHLSNVNDYVQIDVHEFKLLLKKLGIELSKNECEELFATFDVNKTGHIDYIEWTTSLNLEDMLSTPANVHSVGYTKPNKATQGLVQRLHDLGHLPIIDEVESKQYLNFVQRLNAIAETAAAGKVRILIDAEQTYLQVHMHMGYYDYYSYLLPTATCYLPCIIIDIAHGYQNEKGIVFSL